MPPLPEEAPDADPGGGDGDTDAQILAQCTAERETDIGNGRRFRIRFGDLAPERSRHVAISVAHIGWHVFDGARWREDDDDSMIRPLAHATAEQVAREQIWNHPGLPEVLENALLDALEAAGSGG